MPPSPLPRLQGWDTLAPVPSASSSLGCDGLGAFPGPAWWAFPCLQQLELVGVHRAAPLRGLSLCTSLHRLGLTGVMSNEVAVQASEELSRLPSLRELSLNARSIRAAQGLTQLMDLEVLGLVPRCAQPVLHTVASLPRLQVGSEGPGWCACVHMIQIASRMTSSCCRARMM